MFGFSALVVGEAVEDAMVPFGPTLPGPAGADQPNPYARWRRYEVGGRWSGHLLLKGHEGLGTDYGWAGNVDWRAMQAGERVKNTECAYAVVDSLGLWYGPGVQDWGNPDAVSEADLDRWSEWYWDTVKALPPDTWVTYLDCSF